MKDKVIKTDQEWKKSLNDMQYEVLRKGGTEPAGSGSLLDNKSKGIYLCAACNNELFSSEAKYDSKTGWPSFFNVIHPKNVDILPSNDFYEQRNEIRCARCDSHLGHVFSDGPTPTGLRYCVNSAALKFKEKR